MVRMLAAITLLLTAFAASAAQRPAQRPAAGEVRVRIDTAMGPITVAVDTRRAPITAGNFLAYVDQHRFDGVFFYRAARTRGATSQGFVQGGIRHSYTRMLPPIAHEPTSRTGIRHLDGTLSMARTTPGSAMGDFFITVGAVPSMDAHPGAPGDNLGYAAFGHVVSGMPVVRRILAAPTTANAGAGPMRGQYITAPIRIVSARRVP